MSNKPAPDAPPAEQPCAVSRRGFLKFAGVSGLASAASGLAATRAAAAAPDGTPEQIHLTWGDADANEVVVSWASLAAATNPRVRFAGPNEAWRTVHGVQRTYTDGLNGEVVFTYHARLRGLKPGAVYRYEVTADNDANAAQPFAARFETAPRGRAPFRWTSYGDLATPNTGWVLSSPQSRFAVQAVERFQPLFHLLNGDLCYANLNPAHQPAVWRDFGNNNQTSAANRPWMPCPGNHEIEFHNGAQGLDSYLARYTLPENGTRFAGRWYSFRVGAVLFVSLDADDVVYQDAAAFVAGPNPLVPAASTGNEAIAPGTSLYVRGYSRGEQTRWLEQTLRRASRDRDIDWIVVQMHQARSARRRRATARTRASGKRGCRFSIATASISCCAGTITTTSAAFRCAAAIIARASTRRRAKSSIRCSRAPSSRRTRRTAGSTRRTARFT